MIRMIVWVLLMLVGSCTQHVGPAMAPMGRSSQAPAQSVADRLNARYNSAVSVCPGNTPAYECSGILFRRVTYSADHDFWGHSADAVRLGSSTFSFARAGVNSNSADVTSGYILMDPQSAREAGKMELKPRCIYPFMADTQANDRGMHGCGFANQPSPVPLPEDLSNCAKLAIPAVTPPVWIQNFTEHGSDRVRQCSLSTKVPEEFITSLTVRASFQDLTRSYGNEVLMETWDTSTPEQLPIEAIFYNAGKEGSLVNAQALKHSYQVKTNIALPIVQLNFSAGAQRFTLKDADQEDGWTVAQRLNARHADTANECPDAKAAVYCNGVLVRTASYRTTYHAWNPNLNPPYGGLSFSYLRADIKTIGLAGGKGQGIIFRELNYASTAGLHPVEPICTYMTDADTWQRSDRGCGATNYYVGSSESCASQGITTLDQLVAHFLAVAEQPVWQRLGHQCSLAISPVPFMLGIQGRARIMSVANTVGYNYNEIMLAEWPMDIPTQLPLDGFFYVQGTGDAESLNQAREIQKDLWRSADGLIKPVIRMDLNAASNAVFSYQRADQAY